MTRLDDAVIEEVHERGERLLADELVELVEKHHRDDQPGVSRALVDDYVDELEESSTFDAEALRVQLEEHLTDDRSYVDSNAVYELGDDRVSSYPASWHERLDADASLVDVVYVMTHSSGDTPDSASSSGVAKYDLYTAAQIFMGVSRDEAREQLTELRDEGVLLADADQHPRAGVTLTEDADIEKDRFDKPHWGERSSE